MRVAKLKISNILGIEELEVEPGAVTVFEGKNGSGKTSVLEAIKAVVKGGQDATLLRRGAEAGEIVLVMDDGSQARRSVTRKGSTLSVWRDGVRETSPQTIIDSIADMVAVNPVEFIRAPKSRRLEILLDSLKLEADPRRLAEIVGMDKIGIPAGSNALAVIDAIRESVFQERTGTNRAIREKAATASQLGETLAHLPPPPDQTAEELESEIANIEEAHEQEMHRIAGRLDGLRSDHAAAVEALMQQVDLLKDEMVEWERRASLTREKALTDYRESREPVVAKLAATRRTTAELGRAAQLRDTISLMNSDLTSLRADSERQTAALGRLDGYKSELLSSALPGEGLTVHDGEIFRAEVPFDRLNQAAQIETALSIAALRAGDLKVVCVDGIEALDTEGFATFKRAALGAGLQLFMTRVSDGDFAIRSEDARPVSENLNPPETQAH